MAGGMADAPDSTQVDPDLTLDAHLDALSPSEPASGVSFLLNVSRVHYFGDYELLEELGGAGWGWCTGPARSASTAPSR